MNLRSDAATAPARERDLKVQGAVLDLLLLEGQDGATLDELGRHLADEVSLSAEGAIGWAVDDLVKIGLLEYAKDQVRPTPAALHFHMIASV